MSSKSSTSRRSKTPLNHLKAKKWCFPQKSPQRQTSPRTSGSPVMSPPKSPEPNCAICLGKIEDKSFTDRCFHCFCRLCLFEWSKVKAECPVCRQAFEKIIFNIRAIDDYDEELIQTQHTHRFGPFHNHLFMGTAFRNLDGNPRFQYPTTLTPLRRRMMDFERRLHVSTQPLLSTPLFDSQTNRLLILDQMQYQMSDYAQSIDFPQFMDFINNRRQREQRSSRASFLTSVINNNNILRNSSSHPRDPIESRNAATSTHPRVPSSRMRTRDNPLLAQGDWGSHVYSNPLFTPLDIFPPPVGTSAHRRYIYDSDLYVLTNGDGDESRTREVSARFFSSNPACTHRLIPWLNRELNAILGNTSETETLIPRIMNALLMCDITSVGFKRIIAPYTLAKTDHFIHEFYNFARSPYDMDQYTRLSVYVPRHRANIVRSSPLPAPLGFHVESNSPNILSPDSSSSSDSDIQILDAPPNRRVLRRSSPIESPVNILTLDTDSDDSTEIRRLLTPSPVNTPSIHTSETVVNNDISSTSNPTPLPRGDLPDVNFGSIDIIDDFDNPKPGTSGLSSMRPLAQTKWSDSETSDVDVSRELEDAIKRFETNGRTTEIKKEVINEPKIDTNETNDGNQSDCSDSSVLIVGYVKPLHERTPEFVDLISSSEEYNNQNESQSHSKHKKCKRDRHRKRSKDRSRSRSSSHGHSKHKKKCKHKSRDRYRSRSHSRHHRRGSHHKTHRHSRSFRSPSTSSSSTSSSSNCEELRQINRCFKKREHHRRRHRSSDSPSSRRLRHDYRYLNLCRSTNSMDSSVSTPNHTNDSKVVVSTTTSNSRPSSRQVLSSVVVKKDHNLKFKPYVVFSDSE